MRLLIDGYNVMFAQGLVGKRVGPDHFRKARTQFLNKLSDALGPLESHLTTVVFDAATPPHDLPPQSRHKGMTILYAVNDEDADARIEKLIAAHSAPKTLTVVSSDNRIRQAATRRKARVLTADLFLVDIETRKRSPREAPAPPKPEKGRGRELSSSESAYWLNEFRDIEEMPETRAMMGNEMGLPTDAEIAEIEREVEREFREGK
ncbi:NYN domain-containing protein [Singulisphaera acidiphila]|uniref:Putative RNA-binding protein containing a PIN domain n=1 Tax=Singulisphaera acidiphila (strain ATCC BAA-1392 / DSM 18658 / VKM B-2454 / MOB10) TaxID=886293 RepID=L0DDI8_SINAD|nr:NYN domain-containing protein [Singulisphaera acidiphila]AGA27322.1 putative RNA-binding protein containing a PIN domain [Singulisphaera acidiphila DSM 18658]